VVQEPGVYWFNGVKMVCGVSSSFDTGQEKPALFADLPLVFRGVTQYDYKHRGLYRLRRSGYSAQSIAAGIILEDLKGPCAFIDARIKELIIGLCRPEQAPKEQVDEALIPYEKLYREEQAKPQGIRLFLS
jgi:hypothetical protein